MIQKLIKKRLKAVHLECVRKNERKTKRELAKIYERSSTEFPLGIRMRFIADYRDMKDNLNTIKKLTDIRGRKTNFTQKLGSEMSDDILSLDVAHSKYKISLRKMIMGTKS